MPHCQPPAGRAPTRRHALALGAGAIAALAARPARAAPLAFTDALGRAITLKAPAGRIVLGFNYEEFTAVAGVAGWNSVVGFGKALWAGWRPSVYRRYLQAIPRLGELADVGTTDDGTFSLERVIGLRPDLVVLAQWSFASLQPQVEQLASLGIPVMVIDYNAEEPARHAASTIALGIATGNEARGRDLAQLYLGKMAEIRQRLAGVGTRPKAYVELGQGGAGVVGNTYWKGMWGRLLDYAGADNIAANRIPGAWGPLSPEYVLAADPAAIFIAGSSWAGKPDAVLTGFDASQDDTRSRLAPYARRQGWGSLSAIRDGRLYAIEHGLCRALFDYTATLFLARQLHPARFADIDPVAELRGYHERFLPVRFEGCWMTGLA